MQSGRFRRRTIADSALRSCIGKRLGGGRRWRWSSETRRRGGEG